jgi:hypothetical protein
MEDENIRAVREHCEAGRSVCPFAVSRPLRYATDGEPLVPLLSAMRLQEAAVIVADRSPVTFAATREWAFRTFLSALRAAVVVSHPLLATSERRAAVAGVERELRDDASPTFPMIGLRDRPLITICMAPIYPAAHPRFAPRAALVLVHEVDATAIELPRVREAMIAQHGSLYDANQIVLPLPPG